jgi:AcrR family transcriptional regulator
MQIVRPRRMDPSGKRSAVLLAGERLFSERGYHGTTMADVAAAAGVAVGTLYRLFPDKPAVLAALHQNMEDQFIDVMRAAWAGEAQMSARFGPMITALMNETETVQARMPLYALTRDLVGTTDYLPGANTVAAIAAMYAEGMDAGAFTPLDPSLAASIGYGMVEGAIRSYMQAPTPRRKREIARALTDLFNRAFLAVPHAAGQTPH